jgi:hypothetical protein
VDCLVERLLNLLNMRTVEQRHQMFDATNKLILQRNAEPAVKQYASACTLYASQLIVKEIEKAQPSEYAVHWVC